MSLSTSHGHSLNDTQSRWTVSTCVVPTVKHGGVLGWGCFAGDTDLFRIQGTLNEHGYHSILQRYTIQSDGTIICFSTGQWPNALQCCVRAIWPRRSVMECCIRWPGPHNHPTSRDGWDGFGMSWTTEWRKSSKQVLSICGNFFKTIGKAFQVKLVERIPRVCKATIKAKGG